MHVRARNLVTEPPAAPPDVAAEHFAARLGFETDCWDVHATEGLEDRGFVLLDVRSRELYDRGHLPGAVHLPHARISEETLAAWPPDTLFVTYCAGPHCNGSTRAALRLARLGRPVKEMLGGLAGWLHEGYPLAPR